MASDIEFALFAPYNDEVALIGGFSDWEPVPMAKGDDGYFRTAVALEDGSYPYKFRVRSRSFFVEENAWVDVVDPYATAVEDVGEGNGLIFVHGGETKVDTYEWRHDGAPLPPDRDLVIYELHVGDFSGGEADGATRGGFEHVVEKLDHLTELGITAVELMPVMEFPGDTSWGYNPRHFFAAESSYGGSEGLKHLIDECHARGIRVILDLVPNHAESDHPLTKIDYEYWFLREPKDAEHNWGPEFDYGRYDENVSTLPARKFMGDVVRFWIEEYHIDGYRFDAVKQMGDFDLLGWLVEEAKQAAGEKPFYTIGEHIPEIPELVGPDGPLDACWHDSFYHGVTGLLSGKGTDADALRGLLDPRDRGFPAAMNLVNYLTSHDHDHFMYTLGEEGILDDEAFKRARLGAVLTATAFGVPMIWMGTEFGMATAKTIETNKLDWELLKNDRNRELYDLWKGIIALRRQNDALKGDNFEFFRDGAEDGVIGYMRWNDEGSRVVVLANLSGTYHGGYVVEGMPEDGTWREWTRAYEVEVRDGTLTLDLPEFEATVLVI